MMMVSLSVFFFGMSMTCPGLAFMRLGAGDRVSHMVDGAAAGAFDAQIKRHASGEHPVTPAATDFPVFSFSHHGFMAFDLRPGIRPDTCLPLAVSVSRKQADTPHGAAFSVWGRGGLARPVGGGVAAPPPLSFYSSPRAGAASTALRRCFALVWR